MAPRRLIAVSISLCFLAGCGHSGSAPPAAGTSVPQAMVIGTPTLPQQVERAIQAGPGFLNYCPTHNGVNPAKYQLDVPGGPVVQGWCATIAVRRAARDLVTFGAHWNGQRAIHRSGTWQITYALNRTVTATSTPVPHIVKQGGILPP